MKLLLLFIIVVFAPAAFGADTNTSTSEAYYMQLVTILTNVTLRFSFLASIIILLVTGVLYVMKTIDDTSVSKKDLKPMSFLKFIGGIMLASMLFAPINSMKIFNDLTGLYIEGNSNMSVCSAVKIEIHNFDWENNAVNCIANAEEQFKKLAQYRSDVSLSSFNFGLMFGVIQLIAIGFMINSGITLAKHIWGFRQVKTSVGGALVAMTMASAVYASPNVVNYIQDLRSSDTIHTNSGID